MKADWQDIPVFISSTFNDMHAERDYLVKNVFPELAEWCEKRKIRLIDIDLRWGITSEDTRSKNVVKKCLEGIDEDRSIFLCFLGQRRGWVPNDPVRIAHKEKTGGKWEDELGDTTKRYKDIEAAEKRGKKRFFTEESITEIEIEHALLSPMYRIFDKKQPEPYDHALFFFRNEPIGENWNETHRKLYRNDGVLEEGGDVQQTDAKLNSFKAEVRNRTHVINYNCRWDKTKRVPEILPSEKDAIELTYEELKKREEKRKQSIGRLVDFAVPKENIKKTAIEEQLEEIYKEKEEFEAYQNLCSVPLKYVIIAWLRFEIIKKTQRKDVVTSNKDTYALDLEQQQIFIHNACEGFVSVHDANKSLNEYVSEKYIEEKAKSKTMLLMAEAGLGKTTLLAQWVTEKRNTGQRIIARFCGASDLASELYSLWDSICHEQNVKMPDTLDELRQKFISLLHLLSADGKTVIVIDAIDQISEGATMLSWIPPVLPENIKLVLSLKQQTEEPLEVDKTKFEVIQLKPVDGIKKRELISKYLEKNLKELDKNHLNFICGIDPVDEKREKASSNPLYLKILVSELRQFGAFEQLRDQIKCFNETPIEAFDYVLEKLKNEQVFDIIDPSEAVPFLFGILSCARKGLSEDEMACCFLRKFREDEPVYDTIRYLLRRVRPFMARRNGRADFLYDEFRKAASKRYTKIKKVCHQHLKDCFLTACNPDENNSFNSDNIRALVELGYHTTEFDYTEGEQLYSNLAYLDARCSKTSIQQLLSELNQFDSNICRSFFKTILRFQALLSNYPNSLFSICRTDKSLPVYIQTNKLLLDGKWSKPWLDTKQIFLLQDTETESDQKQSSFSMKLIAESEPYVFSSGYAFSPNTSMFVFSKTLEQLCVFDTNTFELLPCIIHVRPIRVISIQFSSDGEYLAVAHEDATIELFRLKYNPARQLLHAVKIDKDILTYKPKRGFSSFGFSNNCIYFQSDEKTISAFDLTTSSFMDLFKMEQSFILDVIVPFHNEVIFSVRQGMGTGIFFYSFTDRNSKKIQFLDRVSARCVCTFNNNNLGLAISDDRILIFDANGNTVTERKMDIPIRFIRTMGYNKMFIICHNDKYIIWDWLDHRDDNLNVEKKDNQLLYNIMYENDNRIIALLDASIAKFEMSNDHITDNSKRKIIAADELPELTVVTNDNNNGITIQQKGFCSEQIRMNEKLSSVCLTISGAYLFGEFRERFYLAPNQKYFQSLTGILPSNRILKSCRTSDGSVYYIDTFWNLCCIQNDFTYDISRYKFDVVKLRSLGNYFLIFGTACGVQSMSSASTQHESLTGTLLIFKTVRSGFLQFCGERLFSEAYGKPIDAAYHKKTDQIYLMFNTPHSGKSKDLLHVCFGTKEELISGKGYHADINIGRRQNANPSTACASDSYLVCYEGNIFAYDAITLMYQSAVAINGSFNSLQPTHNNCAYALALCNNSTGIEQIIPIN